MKNVNLSQMFLVMVANFGAKGFSLNSIISNEGQPIDALIEFNGCDMSTFDQSKANQFLMDSINGDVLQAVIEPKDNVIEVYIEFTNSKFTEAGLI